MSVKQTKTMKEAVDYLADFMGTYADQTGFEGYTTTTYLNDVLYGLGVSLDDKYKYASGFTQFKKDLGEFLNEM